MKFHSPYHFIPVDTKQTKTTDWKEHKELKTKDNPFIRHDYWHSDGESGRITCRITCHSPLVIGGEQIPGNKANPGTVKPYLHPDGCPAIPGNSLRGMISSLAEAISQSAMRVLTSEKESTYSVRKPVKSAQKMRLGLLYKKEDQYRIIPLSEPNQLESLGDYRIKQDRDTLFIKSQQCYQHQQNRQFVSRNQQGHLTASEHPSENSGILYLRVTDPEKEPRMPRKYHETLIPWDSSFEKEIADKIRDGVGIEVPATVIQATESILRMRYKAKEEFLQLPKGYQRPWKDKSKPIIHNGDLIYYDQKHERVTELSYSVIWRSPVKGGGSPHQAFAKHCGSNSLPWNKNRTALTAAEALFGVVEDEPAESKPARNLASRVRFSDATPVAPIKLEKKEITLKILASPKPPSPAMYFSTINGYVAKDKLNMNQHTPNGRKQYLPHPQLKNTWETSVKDPNNWKPHLKCQLIPTTSEFSFQIHYENLSKAELGLLRTALQPGSDFVHRLGLGKPLGLGHIILKIEKIERIERANRYLTPSLTANRFIAFNEPIDNSLIDRDTHEILKILGDPSKIHHPISYPFDTNKGQQPHLETKGFEWFVENDKPHTHSQHLKPLKPGEPLPTLESKQHKQK